MTRKIQRHLLSWPTASAILAAALLCAACTGPIRTEDAAPPVPTVVAEENRTLQPRTSPLSVGSRVPDFALLDQYGRMVTAGELTSGNGSIIVFLPPPDQPAARPAYPWATQADNLLSQRGLEVLLVSPASVDENRRLAETEGIRLAVLSDPASWVARSFGVAGAGRNASPRTAHTAVLGRDGRVQFLQRGLPPPSDLMMAAETLPGGGSTFFDLLR